MNTDQLFQQGVTPKEGPAKGVRYAVQMINKDSIGIRPWDDENAKTIWLRHGSYELWEEPKTLFQDHTIKATVGELKRAIKQSNLPDSTEIYSKDSLSAFFGAYPATFKVVEAEDNSKIIVVL